MSCCRDSGQNSKPDQDDYANSDPLRRHVQQECSDSQSDNQNDEANYVESERHTCPPFASMCKFRSTLISD